MPVWLTSNAVKAIAYAVIALTVIGGITLFLWQYRSAAIQTGIQKKVQEERKAIDKYRKKADEIDSEGISDEELNDILRKLNNRGLFN